MVQDFAHRLLDTTEAWIRILNLNDEPNILVREPRGGGAVASGCQEMLISTNLLILMSWADSAEDFLVDAAHGCEARVLPEALVHAAA